MPIRIPDYITVHLGAPSDSSAPNVRASFADYIKNVASSEIYPTWPESAIRANIYAQISFALNRIYTEYYRSRGYDFDITNSTRYDQAFVNGRDVFENISNITDNIFNNYVVRRGFVEPLFAQYCNGTTVLCDGLSQWGTVSLAEEGLTPYEILQYYYGDDIDIVYNAPTGPLLPSYPGRPLRLGSGSEDVRIIKRQLNRIGVNYPSVRPVLDDSAVFDIDTENAVKSFQQTFDLTADGVVGKATWYRIKSIYNAVKRLSEIQSEGIAEEAAERVFPGALGIGDTGENVRVIQYYLDVLAYFDNMLPTIPIDGIFGERTRDAVLAFQREEGLDADGIVGRDTWNMINDRYFEIIASLPEGGEELEELYPGRFLSEGVTGEDVVRLQTLINEAAERHSFVPSVTVDGVYGEETANAVRAIQANAGSPVTGVTGPLTWLEIVRLARS